MIREQDISAPSHLAVNYGNGMYKSEKLGEGRQTLSLYIFVTLAPKRLLPKINQDDKGKDVLAKFRVQQIRALSSLPSALTPRACNRYKTWTLRIIYGIIPVLTSMKIKAFIVIGFVCIGITTYFVLTPKEDVYTTDLGDPARGFRMVYYERIAPIISETTQRNREAILLAEREINALFSAYESGVPMFTAEIMDWGTRIKIIGKAGADFWHNYGNEEEKRNSVGEYVATIFEDYIVSESQLQRDLDRVLKQFAFDLEANRNVMLSKIETACREVNVAPDILAHMTVEFEDRMRKVTQDIAKDSVAGGVFTLATETSAGGAVSILVPKLISTAAARASQIAATVGGAAAGTAATGAASGAGGGTVLAPGVGTVVGAVTGLTVGILIDMYASRKLEEKLAARCYAFLAETRSAILQGATGAPGLLPSMENAVSILRDETRKSIKQSLGITQ